jgi:putative endonuclease
VRHGLRLGVTPNTHSCYTNTMSGAWVYILKCSDDSYYTGLTRNEMPEAREQQHNEATFPDAYTSTRRPVKLVYAEYLELVTDAITAERKIKGWSRAKKEALIANNWTLVQSLAKRRGGKSSVD